MVPAESVPPPPPQLLVVEDSRVDREVLTRLLRGRGYQVACATSLDEAITHLRAHSPDLILLDEELPDGRSSEHLDRIRAHAPGSPLIFVSGKLDLHTALAISQRSVAAIFSKPITPETLIAKLEELIEGFPTIPTTSKPNMEPAASVPTATPFQWQSFPGLSPAHQRLGTDLAQVRNFDSTLLLLGRDGTAFWPVVRDLQRNSTRANAPLLNFPPKHFTHDNVSARLARFVTTDACLTLALERIDTYSPAQTSLLADLLASREGFTAYGGRLRLVCSAPPALLQGTLTTHLPTSLVARFASPVVNLPDLEALRADLVPLARRLLEEIGADATALSPETVRWIETQPWLRDYRQFRRVILVSAAASLGASPLSLDILRSTLAMEATLPDDAYEPAINLAPTRPADLSSPTPRAATPNASPAARPKRPLRSGAYDFSARLTASLAADSTPAPAPVVPLHPRFAPRSEDASA